MATNKFLPFAAGDDANVMSDDDYANALATNGAFQKGVTTGQASSKQANKTWRQATLMAAAIAQIIADAGSDINDSLTQEAIASLLRTSLLSDYLPLPGGTLTGPLYVRTDGGIGVSLTGVSGGPITSGNTPWSPQFETILNGDGSLKGVWCVRDKVGSYPYLSFQLTDQQGNWYELQYRSDDRLYTSSGKRFLIDADLSGYATTANMLSAGRLLKNTIYTTVGTSTFTPDTKTQWIVVEVQGGGGAGGGCAQTSSNQQAASWGGTAGAYGRSGLYSSSGLTGGVLVTVGAGGSPASGAAGGNGGASSFGSLVTAPGGAGGGLGPANIIGSSLGADGAVSSDATGAALLLSQRGSGGSGPIALGSQTTIRGGTGGRSFLGPGGNGPTGSTSNAMPGYLGGGGSGQALGPSAASSASGGSGGSGCVIVWEYA
ncbi:hypothetical protein [Acetobacter indonesiensis]|uniref:glycine-rich domain-containing protein n=1 Tax=Acetobacter indonesiensis TaxID=104101 RepID=UPI0039EB8E3E